MIEYHGWITIQESASEADAGNLEGAVRAIRDQIGALGWNSGLLQLQASNGTYFLNIGGVANRRNQEIEDIHSLLGYIGRIAPGSYGLLYVRDDEHPAELHNEFRVFVMARGRISEQGDSLLSPCIPVIEDEAD
ncbi:Imm7 family immunity protein [Paenibacillus sp. HJGM_3]|uniref:Imm7 family immunity protein n=1 Tax=Paenibacillus sp. HJGM_3 TaxID=3379816 RepID=UPI0038588562